MITNNIALDRLKTLDLKHSKTGRYWLELPHGQLAYNLLAACAMKRWVPDDLRINLSKDAQDLAISIRLWLPTVKMLSGWYLSIGLTHSNSGHRRLRMFIGASSPDFSVALGRIPFQRKHTFKVHLSRVLDYSLELYAEMSKEIPDIIRQMQSVLLLQSDMERILMSAGRMGIMPWSRIGKVDRLFTLADQPTCWNLMLSFSAIVKMNPGIQQMEQMVCFREMLPAGLFGVPAM